ncbi:MFS transporter [Prevotella sp. PINT]|jgi:Arabinose efflux permease|uniref:MFS transporter n=1 Tax=Palleniella intestinalis TaxID=2736291 RepID=UPI00155329D0|nr:MFS transporter [Palleniella intestinalis]NPD81245.1 MFS transporter [Palleniella intestinalis]
MKKIHVKDVGQTVFPVLFAISFAHFLNDMMQSIVPSIYPMLKDKYGLTFGQIGLMTLVFQMTSSLLQPLVGLYSDKHPHPYSLSTGMMFTFTGIVLLSFAESFGTIVLAVAVIGMGSSIFHPESSRIAQMAGGQRRGLAQSIFQVGGNGGSAIGPLLAAIIILPLGQRSIVWFAIAALVAGSTLFPVGSWYKRQLHRIKAKAVVPNPAVQALSRRRVHMTLLILCVLTFSKYFYMASMTSYFTFFLIDKFGVSIQTSQLCLFAFLASVAIGTLVGGSIGDRYGRKYVIWGSILGAAPFTLALPYVGFTATVVLAIIIGLVISSAFSAILVYATELKPDKIGMMAGLFFGLNFGLGGIGSAFFGWLADRTSVEFIFQVSTLLPLLGVVAGLLPDIERKRKG